MKLVLNHLTYHNCPVDVREKVLFTAQQRHAVLGQMHHHGAIAEAVILQTCNRLEFYLYARKELDCRAFLSTLLASCSAEAGRTWNTCSREELGTDAVRHLFEVACGLDSQMIGENQILAQVKAAYAESLESRMSKTVFHRLFHSAFRAGKAVRTRTSINCGAVSIGLAAVELVRRRVDLPAARTMVIGAGENAELVVRSLAKAGTGGLIIANRAAEKARALARCYDRAEGIALAEVPSRLAEVDAVISTTAAPEYILTRDGVEWSVAGRDRPLLIVDIAVPRDVDPAIGAIAGVSLFNIDDLDAQVAANRRMRKREIPKARAIVEEFVAAFARWHESLDLVPVITKLTHMGQELARNEARRYAGDFGDGSAEKLRSFAESLVKKVLHGPIAFIKDGGGEPTSEQLQAIDLLNKMFLAQSEDPDKEVS